MHLIASEANQLIETRLVYFYGLWCNAEEMYITQARFKMSSSWTWPVTIETTLGFKPVPQDMDSLTLPLYHLLWFNAEGLKPELGTRCKVHVHNK